MKLGTLWCEAKQEKTVFQEEMPFERERLANAVNNSLVLAIAWVLMPLAKINATVASLEGKKSYQGETKIYWGERLNTKLFKSF